jgi:hypothetical protein
VALSWLTVSGCLIDVDYGGTQFSCADEPTCPDGFVCVEDRCVVPGDVPDGGDGDAAAAIERAITVSGQVSGTLAGAPVLVSLDAARIDYSRVAPDGGDLRFVDAGGAPLAHEIERWDPSGTSVVWVKLPALETGASFTMIYGDGDEAAGSQRPAEVWTAYDLVYHLSDSGADSSSGFDATPQNQVSHAGGKIGGAALFDGVDDYYEIGQDLPLLRAAPGGSASAWVRLDDLLTGSILEISINGDVGSRMFLNLQETTAVTRLGVRTQDLTSGAQNADGVDAAPVGEWVWVAGASDFAAQTTTIYFNGAVSATTEMLLTDAMTPDTNSDIAVIGADDGLVAGGFFPGAIDEVRCAARALGPEWIAAQYLSMTDALLTFE